MKKPAYCFPKVAGRFRGIGNDVERVGHWVSF
jgi:hypothetical protein